MGTTTTKQPSRKTTSAKSYHDRRLARRLDEDPEFRAEYERQLRAIKAIDSIVNDLDALRQKVDCSKADLARAIGKNPAAIRRLLTASGNPELRTVVALADALDADVQIVPRKGRPASRGRRKHAVT